MPTEFDNEEDALNNHKNAAEKYFGHKIGSCFICPNQPLAEDMICIQYNCGTALKTWYICSLCHKAYYYHGYTSEDIGKTLLDYEKRRKYLPDKELKDVARGNHLAITLEEQAELSWMLRCYTNKKWEEYIK